jgi:hypothetical protein
MSTLFFMLVSVYIYKRLNFTLPTLVLWDIRGEGGGNREQYP